MKKIIFYIPFIFFSVIYVLLTFDSGIESIFSIAVVWLLLFLISAILFGREIITGCLFGTLPGLHWIYMGTKYTGQIINEMTLGIATVIFFVGCGYYVYRKKVKR